MGDAPCGLFNAKIVKLSFSTDSYEFTGYAKQLAEYEFYAELMCAVVGRSIGMSIPEPVIAIDARNNIYFVSMAVNHPDVNHFINLNGESFIWKNLSNWSQACNAASFDEWIANGDRNRGNILFGGNENIYLIDHNLAMDKSIKHADPIAQNTFLTIKEAFSKDDVSKQRLRNNIEQSIIDINSSIPQQASQIIASVSNNNAIISEMTQYLEARLLKLADITLAKIKTDQQNLWHST